MTPEEEKRCRDLVQQVRDLKSAMCCYDEMLLLLEVVAYLNHGGDALSGAAKRMDLFDAERLVKTRLPDVLKVAKRARLMRHSDPYWPENFIMSSFVNPDIGEDWKK